MWHEARKQERRIRGLIVDYRKRAERRQDFYEKIQADPTQFIQVHGRRCKIHLDAAVAAAGDGAAIIVPWQGQQDILIDRFDCRSILDYIPPTPKLADNEQEELTLEERQCNYERYRILAQNDFLNVPEEKFLHQLSLEEQYGANAQLEAERNLGKKKLPPKTGATIGYSYDDTENACLGNQSFGQMLANTMTSEKPTKTRSEKDSDSESDSDIDMDVSIDISKLDTTQAHELNGCGRNYGMLGNDFFSYLTKDIDEADALRIAREEEQEKMLLSGRKSRRERRAQKERRIACRPFSPPSYAAKEEEEEPSAQKKKDEESDSRSPSPADANAGKITYITSFGGEDELQPHSKITLTIGKGGIGQQHTLGELCAKATASAITNIAPAPLTYAQKVKENLEKLKESRTTLEIAQKRDLRHSRSRSCDYRKSRSYSRSSRRKYINKRDRSRSRSHSESRTKSRSRYKRGRSRSTSRVTSSRQKYKRHRSRERRKYKRRSASSYDSSSSSSDRSSISSHSYRSRHSRSSTRSRHQHSRRRSDKVRRSISKTRTSLSPQKLVGAVAEKKEESMGAHALFTKLKTMTAPSKPLVVKTTPAAAFVLDLPTAPPPPPPPPQTIAKAVDISEIKVEEPPPLKRYYGRKRNDDDDDDDDSSSTSSSVNKTNSVREPRFQRGADANDSDERMDVDTTSDRSNPQQAQTTFSSSTGKEIGKYTSSTTTSTTAQAKNPSYSSATETKVSTSSGSGRLNLRERLKRKMQNLLNKQYKADKRAEIEKTERERQLQQEREDEMRELALKLRRRQRELRHRYGTPSSGKDSESEASETRNRTSRSRSCEKVVNANDYRKKREKDPDSKTPVKKSRRSRSHSKVRELRRSSSRGGTRRTRRRSGSRPRRGHEEDHQHHRSRSRNDRDWRRERDADRNRDKDRDRCRDRERDRERGRDRDRGRKSEHDRGNYKQKYSTTEALSSSNSSRNRIVISAPPKLKKLVDY